MKDLIWEAFDGSKTKVGIELGEYAYTCSLAIRLILAEDDNENGFLAGETYSDLTVNLSGYRLDEGEAFVDTNNLTNAEEFIKKYKLGEPLGYCGKSGFCEYPAYKFDLKRLKTLSEDFAKSFVEKYTDYEMSVERRGDLYEQMLDYFTANNKKEECIEILHNCGFTDIEIAFEGIFKRYNEKIKG